MLDWAESAFQNFQASPYFWDVITIACLGISVLGVMLILMWLLGLPGRIAIARKHPDAEAVYLMGWVGFAAVVPWIQALIWAFKPTDKIDIRYFPKAEAEAERASLEALTRYVYGKKKQRGSKKPAADSGRAHPALDLDSAPVDSDKEAPADSDDKAPADSAKKD